MQYIIVYAKENNEPRQIPDSELKAYLEKGFRREPLKTAPAIDPSTESAENIEITEIHVVDGGQVAINSAGLTALAKALPLSTAILKDVIAERKGNPYKTIEDLIDRAPLPEGLKWTSYEKFITFD